MNDPDVMAAYLDSIDEEMMLAGIDTQPVRPEGFGITIKEYYQKKKCPEAAARVALNMAVQKGLLICHKMCTGPGANSLVYCRPNEWPPK
jgi:hypothetical protein